MELKERGYFKTTLVEENIWSIDGPANDLMYLVIGSRKAMLVDTGMGIGDLASLVESLTHLPVVVVNTHGHPDHAGGNSNFDEVWLPARDEHIMLKMCSNEYRLNDVKALVGENNPDTQRLIDGLVPSRIFKVHYIRPGQRFNLGDRQYEVIEIPGHTPGSIGVLNENEHHLFSGDSIVATPAWLYLKHSLPLKTFLDALKRIDANNTVFNTIFPGHQPTPLGREYLSDLIACAQEILARPGIGEPAKTFVGEGIVWTHGKSQIIYNPENLH